MIAAGKITTVAVAGWLLAAGCTIEATDPELGDTPAFAEGEEGVLSWQVGADRVELPYQVSDGVVVTGGDMVLGTAEDLRWVDGVAAGALGNTNTTGWPDDTIFYRIDPQLESQRGYIEDGIERWESTAHFRFVERTSPNANEHHLVFRPKGFGLGAECQADLGFIWWAGEQSVFLTPGRCFAGTVAHEIGHALGLMHEHQRTDRDEYVVIHTENIAIGRTGDFVAIAPPWGPYEIRSLMHYRGWAASINNDPTITQRDCTPGPGVSCTVGTTNWVKPLDVAAAVRASHGPNPGGFRLRNADTNRCLSAPLEDGWVFADRAVYTGSCTSSERRRWYLTPRAFAGGDMLVNQMGRVCLSGALGDPAVRTCDRHPDNRVKLIPLKPKGMVIQVGKMCLADAGRGVTLAPCADVPAMTWFID